MAPGSWHILLDGVVGSTAHGLAGADSDVDRLAVAAAPTAAFLGLGAVKGSHVTTGPDCTVHEVGKFLKLALKANPSVTELLWLSGYDYSNRFGLELVQIRAKLLAAPQVRRAYLGYATDQFTKLKSRGDGSFSADTRKRTSKHARHLARLCHQGYQLYATGTLQIRVDDPQSYLDFGDRVAGGDLDVAQTLMARTEADFDEATPALPQEPDVDVIQDWLLRVRRHYYR
jgi:uncharacterized protein